MKIRDGFVSNSSSSSFVVIVKDWLSRDAEPDLLATPADIEKLIGYGFTPSSCMSPSSLEAGAKYRSVRLNGKYAYSLVYSVSCNEDDVIEFLVENDIPFKAAVHYGHASVFYRRGEKAVRFVANPGVAYEMYGASKSYELRATKVEKAATELVPVSEYRKDKS